MKDKLNFSVFEQSSKVVPTFTEKKTSNPFINYGHNNQFPNYLWDLYLRSALLQSIIGGISNYTEGNGITYNEAIKLIEEANQDGETLDDIIKKVITDYLVFGGFAIQVIYNKLGEVNELYWLDFRNVRTNDDITKIYYSKDWIKHSRDYLTYDVFGSGNTQTEVFYFKGHITRGVYPIPRYNGALNAIETSVEISKFHLNSILNNFSGNFIINFNNGQPDEETQGIIEKGIKDKFSGTDNAGKFMVAFNDSKENAVSIERIQDDSFDKKYSSLREDTFKEIFVAFRAIPQLFGYSLEGTGFSAQEFSDSFKLFYKTTIKPIQRDLKRCFNKIFDMTDSLTFSPFTLEGETL